LGTSVRHGTSIDSMPISGTTSRPAPLSSSSTANPPPRAASTSVRRRYRCTARHNGTTSRTESGWQRCWTYLRAALNIDPSLPPAWTNLAVVLARLGREQEAANARERAAASEADPPRGFPYGVGNGYLLGDGAGQRFMLVLSDDAGSLALYHPARSRLSRR